MRIRTALATGLIATGAALATTPAWATPGNGDNVTLCHRTDANNNPYVQITVDPDAVFRQGHDGHDGPVWNSSLKSSGQKWGDIIPPFDYTAKHGHTTTSAHYDGKNWTSDGRAVYDNGCSVPTQQNPSSPPTTPSHSSTPSQTPSQTQTPTSTPSSSHTPTQPPSTPPSSPTQPPTAPPTQPPTAPPTFPPTAPPTHSPTVPPTHSPTVPPVPSHSPTPPIVCAGCPLPHTGIPVLPMVAAGAGMVLIGAGLLRRRS